MFWGVGRLVISGVGHRQENAGRELALPVVGVHHDTKADLTYIGLARDTARGFLNGSEARKQDADQNADNGDGNKNVKKSEGLATLEQITPPACAIACIFSERCLALDHPKRARAPDVLDAKGTPGKRPQQALNTNADSFVF